MSLFVGKNRMKILFISEYFPPHVTGGGEISCNLLAKYLAIAGINITVLTSHFDNLPKEEMKEGVRILRNLKTGKDPGKIFSNIKRTFFLNSLKKELKNLLNKEKFDIIHFFNITSIPAAKISKNLMIPIIAHINSPVVFDPVGTLLIDNFKGEYTFSETISRITQSKYIGKIKNRFFLRFNPLFWIIIYKRYKNLVNSIKYFNFLTPISNDTKERLIKIGFSKKNIQIIPNIFEGQIKKNVSFITKKEIKILYLGSYIEGKGVLILLDALRHLNIPYKADFYGKGILKDYLINIKKIEKLPINIYNFVNPKEVLKIISNADVLIVPSIFFEAFGRVVLEGMSQGKVVIASEIGGLKEIIKDNYNGLLIKPSNSLELTKAIERIYSDKKLYFKLAFNALKSIKNYSGNKISRNLIKIYSQVLKEHKNETPNKKIK